MKQSINRTQFHDAFRAIRPDNFSYEGLDALYEHLTDLEESVGEEIELDVIALCCDFAEVSSGEIYEDDEVISELENGNFLIQNG